MRLKILNCPGGGPFRSKTFYVLLINGVGFPGGSVVKNLPPNAGNEDLIPGLGRSPGEDPTPVFSPGKSHRQRSLAGFSLWGHKELDMTEQVNHSNN